jgi:uncharacterized protein (TIGR03435 family)
MLRWVSAGLLFGSVLAAQSFDVATVKPVTLGSGRFVISTRGGPGSSDPSHFYAENSTLLSLIMMAYGVPSFRLEGPSWLGTERFNITANVPAGITREQFLIRLQKLLAERLGLAVHEEERPAPAFALVIDKGGLRMKESAVVALAEGGVAQSPGVDKDGIAIAPAGVKGLWMNFGGGRFVIQGHQERAVDLAEALTDQLDQPVTDATGLQGRYDFRLEFAPVNVQQADDSVPSIFSAVRQLGLRLEPRKVPAKMIVVDHVEKTPIAN